MPKLQVRINGALSQEFDHFIEQDNSNRSEILRMLIRTYIRKKKREAADVIMSKEERHNKRIERSVNPSSTLSKKSNKSYKSTN